MLQSITAFIPRLLAIAGASVPGHNHDCNEVLGHHWMMPAYRSEIYLQLAAIITVVVFYLLARVVMRMRRQAGDAR